MTSNAINPIFCSCYDAKRMSAHERRFLTVKFNNMYTYRERYINLYVNTYLHNVVLVHIRV